MKQYLLYLVIGLFLFQSVYSDPISEFHEHIHYSNNQPNRIGYIHIGDHEEAITEATWLFVRQALNYYREIKPSFIILELNTPGGEVFAAQKISDALKNFDLQEKIPIVAYINDWAISAGAMLAYSCRFITVASDGSMGAAEPVYLDEMGKMEAASEKVNSVLRTDFANRARFYGRNPLIAEAMVDKDLILVRRDGKIVKLDNESQIIYSGSHPDALISAKGKLLTLDANQMIEYGVADTLVPVLLLPRITDEEKSKGRWPAEKMALFHTSFFKDIPNATIDAYQMDWKTRFFVFLATPMISSILLMCLMIGGYIELNHPGVTLPGSIAAISLFLLMLSRYSLELANWLEFIFFFTGAGLILIELFLLPTFGFLGFFGIFILLVGLIGMLIPGIGSVHFIPETHTLNAAGEFVLNRLGWFSATLILSAIIILFLARYVMPRFSGFQRFVLTGNEQDASKGFTAGMDSALIPKVGSKGVALSILRPAGKIMVEEKIFDGITSGEWIDQGAGIEIIRIEGSQITVKKIKDN